jgi:hypothetical protein
LHSGSDPFGIGELASYSQRSEVSGTRDLLSGDYVSLRYEIGLLPERFEERDYKNKEVYVTLEPSGPVWEVQDVSNVPPAEGKPYLKVVKKIVLVRAVCSALRWCSDFP